MSRPDRSRALALAFAVASAVASLGGCAIPYPISVGTGFAEVPPSPDNKPLASGAWVTLVPTAPAGCGYLGLATGVGGATDADGPASPARDALVRARAVVSLRNAVGDVGGSHVTVDAEEAWTRGGGNGFGAVVVRGAAFRCR